MLRHLGVGEGELRAARAAEAALTLRAVERLEVGRLQLTREGGGVGVDARAADEVTARAAERAVLRRWLQADDALLLCCRGRNGLSFCGPGGISAVSRRLRVAKREVKSFKPQLDREVRRTISFQLVVLAAPTTPPPHSPQDR